MIPLLQDISYSYSFIFARPFLEQQLQESYIEMVDMIYKIHPKSAAEGGYLVPDIMLNTVNKEFIPGIPATGVSRLPAAEQYQDIRSISGSNIYHDSLHVKGGDCPKIMDNIKFDNVKSLLSQMRNIRVVDNSYIYFDVLDDMKGIASKTLTVKHIMNYLRCVPRMSPDNWGQVGVWGQFRGITPPEVPCKGSLCKISCKNGLNH